MLNCDENVINSYKVDYIVHCAGEASVDLHNTSQNTDYIAIKKLLQITKNSNIKKLIFLSSKKWMVRIITHNENLKSNL